MFIDLKFTLITKPVIGYNEKNKFVHVQVVSAAIQCLLPSSNCKIPFSIKKKKNSLLQRRYNNNIIICVMKLKK